MRSNIANAAGATNLTMLQLMKQQKFLEEFGIDPNVVNVADGSKIVSALLGGDMDISTMSGFGQVFPAIERGGKLKILAGALLLPPQALFTAKPNIQTLKDLEGKNVGSGSPGALVHQLTVALLKKKGVDYRRVRFVNIGSSVDVFRAVTVGTIDAGLGEATYVEEQDKYKVRALPGGNLSTELPEYTYQGAYTTDRAIEGRRDLLVRTLAAYSKLYRFVHKPEAKEAFFRARSAALRSTTPQESEILWQFLQKHKPYAVNLALSEERLRYMQELNIELGVQKTVLPFAQVADMSIARDAVKLLGGEE
jgi:ABC-type nitrate/sulfonate/bicarbonate transport system substrate-binding protein